MQFLTKSIKSGQYPKIHPSSGLAHGHSEPGNGINYKEIFPGFLTDMRQYFIVSKTHGNSPVSCQTWIQSSHLNKFLYFGMKRLSVIDYS